MTTLTDPEFAQFQRFIFDAAGITLSNAKKALVTGRLAKRLTALQLRSYAEYMRILCDGTDAVEVQTAIDLLTTNETYFFREPRHFELLRERATEHAQRGQPMRVWSAACSSGEEAYSIAMVLEDCLGPVGWEVTGSDISSRVLARARQGHYPMERARHVPLPYLRRFCLKGQDEQAGTLLVQRALRERMRWTQVNLNTELPSALGAFDMVFLRNVMIYFNGDTKRQVVQRVLGPLRAGGLFVIGHSESLNDICSSVQTLAPSVYRKP